MPEPTSIETLLEWNGEEGTHSILDIRRTSLTPCFGAAAPLPPEQLVDLFGADKPTRRMVEEKTAQLQALRPTWHGTYVIAYKDDEPSEILFTGFSGD